MNARFAHYQFSEAQNCQLKGGGTVFSSFSRHALLGLALLVAVIAAISRYYGAGWFLPVGAVISALLVIADIIRIQTSPKRAIDHPFVISRLNQR